MSILSKNAQDIILATQELCLVLGYMASPNRIGLIEAQIPEDKIHIFLREFPNAPYYPIKQGKTTGDHVMKQGCQLRIYFNNITNCPQILIPFFRVGAGKFVKRINKSKFVEQIVKNFGFSFGKNQSDIAIRKAIREMFPNDIKYFDSGYKL